MNFRSFLKLDFRLLFIAFAATALLSSCNDDDKVLASMNFDYAFHNGQAVPSAPYGGIHANDFSASMKLDEMDDDKTLITINLNNTIDGAVYHLHAHDAADPASTPNGTPYNETPNSSVFAQMVTGNGGTMTIEQEADMAFDELTTSYEGFFVIHDPLQDISTTDITTYLVVGGFARAQASTSFQTSTFNYAFNTGQVAAPFAYAGTHANTLGASITVDELADKRTRVTVRLMNTMDGMMYHTHAHDMADAATTPNGTPYIETPNSGVFAAPIMGNGAMAGLTNISDMTYSDLTSTYDGFFVVHDPLQDITTTDPTTYVVLGVFAR